MVSETRENAIANVKTLDVKSFRDMKALQERVQAEIKEQGLVVLENFAEGGGDDAAAKMEELMIVFGGKEGMSSFGATPMDPNEAGDDGDQNAKKCQVDGRNVRRLGNTMGADGKPTSLLAKAGYEWHQDANNVDATRFKGSTMSMLYCVATVKGSETLFAHCKTLWERLTDEQQQFLQNAEAIHSNASTAGGPAAVDSAFGLRMNASGTKRVRDANRRRRGWKLNEQRGKLCGVDEHGNGLLWSAVKNFDHFVVDGVPMDGEESRELFASMLDQALGVIKHGEMDDECETITKTEFDPSIVMPAPYAPGVAVIWDNTKWLHSTTPINIYEPGDRIMFQLNQHSYSLGNKSDKYKV